jgi:hypothetical protein
MQPEDRKKLGAFRSPILQLLDRNPIKRPTMTQFYENCNSIFSTSVTYTPGSTTGKELMGGMRRSQEDPKGGYPYGDGDTQLSI